MIDKKLKLEAGLRRLKMKGGSGRGKSGADLNNQEWK